MEYECNEFNHYYQSKDYEYMIFNFKMENNLIIINNDFYKLKLVIFTSDNSKLNDNKLRLINYSKNYIHNELKECNTKIGKLNDDIYQLNNKLKDLDKV